LEGKDYEATIKRHKGKAPSNKGLWLTTRTQIAKRVGGTKGLEILFANPQDEGSNSTFSEVGKTRGILVKSW